MANQIRTPPPAHKEVCVRGNNAEERMLAMARTCRRKSLPPEPGVPLQNHFTALQTEEERPVTSRAMLDIVLASFLSGLSFLPSYEWILKMDVFQDSL